VSRKIEGNIRRRILIKGKLWKVLVVRNLSNPDHGPCLGDCDPDKRIIKLEKYQTPESKFRTFIHELFHAIHYEAHATEAGGVDGILGEILAESCTDVITGLFDLDWKNRRKKKPNV
jgi:hypothetical protein